VRDRLPTKPEPDPGGAGEPDRRPLPWRLLAGALIFILGLIGVWLISGDYVPPDPAECAALRDVVAESPDVVYEMERRGCPNAPYERLR